jgi:hypothetical protein
VRRRHGLDGKNEGHLKDIIVIFIFVRCFVLLDVSLNSKVLFAKKYSSCQRVVSRVHRLQIFNFYSASQAVLLERKKKNSDGMCAHVVHKTTSRKSTCWQLACRCWLANQCKRAVSVTVSTVDCISAGDADATG